MSERTASALTPSITAALQVERGFALFPLRAGSKLPAVARDWEHAATTSPARLRRLSADPHANYGVACGPSNLVVVDLDVAKEAEAVPGEPVHGLEVLRDLAGGRELPRTFTVGTPSGGRHLYFRPPPHDPAPRNTVRRLGPLIDTRGSGGYVVAPGSRVNGVPYTILEDAPIAELPEWISALLRPLEARPAAGEPLALAVALGPVRARLGGAYARTALERETARVESARVGTRNDTLNRAAYSLGTLVGSGVLDQASVEAELTRAALAAGLGARETAGTVRSGLTAGIARPRRLVGVGASAAAAGVHQLSLEDEQVPDSVSGNGGADEAPARVLIPALVPPPADWPRVFGPLDGLGAAASALRRELAACAPGFALPPEALSQDPETELAPAALVGLLDELDAAFDLTARAGGALAGSARWQGIRTLGDLLRDLRDELEAALETLPETAREPAEPGPGAPAIPEQAFALVRALAAVAAGRIAALAEEIAGRLGADGLHRSPVGHALRRIRRAAAALAGAGAPPAPLTPAGFATGRGALQAQLAAMRRELRAATARGDSDRAA